MVWREGGLPRKGWQNDLGGHENCSRMPGEEKLLRRKNGKAAFEILHAPHALPHRHSMQPQAYLLRALAARIQLSTQAQLLCCPCKCLQVPSIQIHALLILQPSIGKETSGISMK